jgi:hypothetical protein
MPVPGHVVHADVIKDEQHERADPDPIEVVAACPQIFFEQILRGHEASHCVSGGSVGAVFNHRNEPGISGTQGRMSGEYVIMAA